MTCPVFHCCICKAACAYQPILSEPFVSHSAMVLPLLLPTGLFLSVKGFLFIALVKWRLHAPVLQTLRHLKNTTCVKNTIIVFLQNLREVKQIKVCTTALETHGRRQSLTQLSASVPLSTLLFTLRIFLMMGSPALSQICLMVYLFK